MLAREMAPLQVLLLLLVVTAGDGVKPKPKTRVKPNPLGPRPRGPPPISLPRLGCRDQQGKFVDWYVLYKLPRLVRQKSFPFIKRGIGYMFYSSTSKGRRFFLSDVSIENQKSIPGRTLQPIYDDAAKLSLRPKLIYAFYNDAHPNHQTDGDMGHAKGVVAFDGNRGFWMVHSVPRFPPYPSMKSYSYPKSGTKKGQAFLCISLKSKKLEKVATQLLFNEPHLYASKLPPSLQKKYPKMHQVINGIRSKTAPHFSVVELHETGNRRIVSFAKEREFGKDLYHGLVAPNVRRSMFVQTWRTTVDVPSNCTGCHSVYNVVNIKPKFELPPSFEYETVDFRYTVDHSKWAVSDRKNWVCIGDINRALSQQRRGGGTVCLENDDLGHMFYDMVADHEPCPP